MKLFSRKALVAGAAAVALSFAGTSVATAEETKTGGSSVSDLFGGSSFSDSKNDTNDDGDGNGNKNPKKDGSSDPKEISAWISVFTAVIGALGALFSFASKNLGFKL